MRLGSVAVNHVTLNSVRDVAYKLSLAVEHRYTITHGIVVTMAIEALHEKLKSWPDEELRKAIVALTHPPS